MDTGSRCGAGRIEMDSRRRERGKRRRKGGRWLSLEKLATQFPGTGEEKENLGTSPKA